jgi:Sigma-70 region 2
MRDNETPEDIADADAVADLQRDEVSGLEPLLRRYQSSALRLAIALTGDRERAEDAVRDAFIAVYRSIGSLASVAAARLPPILARFYGRCPNVELAYRCCGASLGIGATRLLMLFGQCRPNGDARHKRPTRPCFQ